VNVAPIAAAPASPDAPKPKNIAEASKQFEAILIAQMLKTAHPDSESDSEGGAMLDLAGQHFAQVMADNGGLGLSKLIVKGLEHK
jgi:Rod binding domain-containing protein